jgi:hypothetical protein
MLMGEVAKDDVLLIITRTRTKDYDNFLSVVKQYYEEGNYNSTRANDYDIAVKPLHEVEALANKLYSTGKIHQPLNFANLGNQFIHP